MISALPEEQKDGCTFVYRSLWNGGQDQVTRAAHTLWWYQPQCKLSAVLPHQCFTRHLNQGEVKSSSDKERQVFLPCGHLVRLF